MIKYKVGTILLFFVLMFTTGCVVANFLRGMSGAQMADGGDEDSYRSGESASVWVDKLVPSNVGGFPVKSTLAIGLAVLAFILNRKRKKWRTTTEAVVDGVTDFKITAKSKEAEIADLLRYIGNHAGASGIKPVLDALVGKREEAKVVKETRKETIVSMNTEEK